MTSITAQQTKLDLELVPKENRLDIGKCNGRIPRRLKPKEETFQVVLDALALTPCYPAFIITADVPEKSSGDILQICHDEYSGRDFDALHSEEDTLSFLRDLGHTSVINSLNDVVIDQMHQPWRTFAAIINKSLSGKTSGLDKLCVVPPKIARKFKKASPTKKDSDLVPVDEEPVTKGKRVKRSVKKSSTKPATGIVIREPPVETKSKGKEKEKVDVAHGKGIELLSEVALTEKAQLKEVRKKSLRDFHKTHPSGSGTGAKKPPSVEKITPTVTSEGTGDKPGVPDVTEDDSTESESESWGNDEDDSNNEQEASDKVSGQENESEEQESDSEQHEESDDDNQEGDEFDQENESKDNKIESDEDKGMDDTTNQFDDDVDTRLEEPTQTGKEVVQGEGADVEMIDAQQGNENLETTQEQQSVILKNTLIKLLFTVLLGCKDPFSLSGPSSGIRALRNSEQEEQLKTVIHLQPTKLNMSETQDENPPPPPPPATINKHTQQITHLSLKNDEKFYAIIFQLAKCRSVSENTAVLMIVSTAYGVSDNSGHYSKLLNEKLIIYSLLASQSSCPQLDHEDLDQKKEDNRRRDGWNPGNKDGSRTGKKEESKALVTVDGECVDWTTHSEDDENYAFMASNS
ncbi:hypothetical protein Tco_0643330 [Tanacetum coccineum]